LWIVEIFFTKIYDTFEKLDIMTTLIPRFECIRTDFEHFKTKSKLSCFIQNTARLNSDQLKESWVGFEIRKNYLTVRNAEMKGIELVIPKSKIRKGFRTTSNIKVINVDKILGYFLVSPFNKMKEKFLKYIFNDKKLKGFDFKEFDKILRRFENRNSYLILNRRLYLASPGTSYVAFCSNTPFIGLDTWGFTNMNYDEAKLIALWLNSTFGILQLLMIGAAIEGNWMKVHKYMLEDLYIPEPAVFLELNSDELNVLYEKVSNIEVPSLTEQLRMTYNVRQEIDRFFIEKLGLEIWNNYGTLNKFLKLIQKE